MGRPPTERTEPENLVLVRLSEIPEPRRTFVAEEMIRVGALKQTEAIDLRLAAIVPRQNPGVYVTADRATKARGPGFRGIPR